MNSTHSFPIKSSQIVVADLKKYLHNCGLSTIGFKSELVVRLNAFYNKHMIDNVSYLESDYKLTCLKSQLPTIANKYGYDAAIKIASKTWFILNISDKEELINIIIKLKEEQNKVH